MQQYHERVERGQQRGEGAPVLVERVAERVGRQHAEAHQPHPLLREGRLERGGGQAEASGGGEGHVDEERYTEGHGILGE